MPNATADASQETEDLIRTLTDGLRRPGLRGVGWVAYYARGYLWRWQSANSTRYGLTSGLYCIEEYSQHGDSRVGGIADQYETLDMRADDIMCRCVRVDIRRNQVRRVVYGVPSEPKNRALSASW